MAWVAPAQPLAVAMVLSADFMVSQAWAPSQSRYTSSCGTHNSRRQLVSAQQQEKKQSSGRK